jgi:hypothetical protein
LPALTPDQNVVRIGQAMLHQQLANQRTEAPLHAVTDYGIADSFGNGNPEAQSRAIIRAGKQDEPGPCDPQSAIGSEEISAPCQYGRLGRLGQAESFLRPRARRARSTLRPPTVAVRARKPWRRARTRLLGWKVRFMVSSENLTKTATPIATPRYRSAVS